MDARSTSHDKEFRFWAIALHLSMLSGLLIPYAGYVVPIVIWQMQKDVYPEIDRHGRNAVNWMISSFLYSIAAFLLIFTFIGIPASVAIWIFVGIAGIAFPVIAGIKANDGKSWHYPASIRFL